MKKLYLTILVLSIIAIVGFAVNSISGTIIRSTGTTTPILETDNIIVHDGSNTKINASEINNVIYVQAGNASDIQAKIDKCGNTVIMPDATYNITSRIVINCNNTYLQGTSKEKTKLICYLNNVTDCIRVDGKENITFSNFQIDCIDNNQCRHGIVLNYGSNNIDINQMFIQNINNSGIYVGYSENVFITDSVFLKSTRGIYFDNVNYSQASNNKIRYMTFNGMETDGDTGATLSQYNIFSNNIIRDTYRGIVMEACDGCSIMNNHVINTEYMGINLGGDKECYNCKAIGNTIYNSTGRGISASGSTTIYSKNNLISDNILSKVNSTCIQIAESYNTTVHGNIVTECGTSLRTEKDAVNTRFVDNTYLTWTDNGNDTYFQSYGYFDSDIRIKNLIYTNISSNFLGIRDSNPQNVLSVKSGTTSSIVATFNATKTTAFICISDQETTDSDRVCVGSQGNNLLLRAGGADRIKIGTSIINHTVNSFFLRNVTVNNTLTLGDGTLQRNITLTSPDASEHCCGVANDGIFSCSVGACQ